MKSLPLILQAASFFGMWIIGALIALQAIDALFGLTALLSLLFVFVDLAGE